MEITKSGYDYLVAKKLTIRQLEVVSITVKTFPCTEKDIAKELNIAVKSVRYHMTKIYRALGVRSKVDLFIKLNPHIVDRVIR